MTTERDLLPPNAPMLVRGLAAAVVADFGSVDLPLAALWDPETCPMPLLPWLAWGLSVDSWDPEWPDSTKRAAVANSIAEHRIKGTRASVEAVLERFDALLRVVEWHEAGGSGVPHTFEVILPMVTAPGVAPSGERSTAAFADKILREVSRTKRLSQHFQLVQQLAIAGQIGVQSAARAALFIREEFALGTDDSQPWGNFLQTEAGEPIQAETGAFLEDVG
ncbi:phage tail protein I [Sphingomonas koreensis]|uniref:phage tail protein I n=1 Tax=Sphingomonas koreensis TaxID=93064 RepID=UPI000836BE2B|nr:phage tail protein I [Sphingomonas koreensis]PJI89070.1 phage tail P2-like protein [Sphingomonas koreensis]RSU63349.1 phage tail protein I [Sphingomonas koreensis]RSU71014.1 phage tail protein I [Sphingomonas koreensis]